ncbi:MAG: restriction endonuclease subunit S [Desulfamplus sp.]|nr:restriction endonuclease subunit S [Desulfamplus sp.]
MNKIELKEGYKKTEVGVIPEDWEIFIFGDIIDYTKGFPFRSKDYQEDGIRIIRVSDTTFDGIKKENGIYISEKNANDYKKWRLDESDLIFTTVGSKPPLYDSMVGKVIIVSKEFEGSFLNQNAVFIRAKKRTKEKQALLLNHFRTKRYLQYIELIYRGNANQASINLKELFAFKIPLPSTLTEQTAIANALSDADALITSLEKLIAKKRNIKQGAMQKLLQPKEGWEVKRLGEVGECIIGLTYTPENVKESGTLVLRSSNIRGSTLKYDDNVYVNSHISEKLINQENDILICVRNGSRNLIGKCALIGGVAIGQTFGAFMAMYRSHYNQFVIHLFQSDIIKKQIDEHLGATINQITNKSLNSFAIPFPSLEEQKRIATILSDMDNEITALENKLEKYKNIKLGMMQNLLTGKIRLVD